MPASGTIFAKGMMMRRSTFAPHRRTPSESPGSRPGNDLRARTFRPDADQGLAGNSMARRLEVFPFGKNEADLDDTIRNMQDTRATTKSIEDPYPEKTA